MPIEQFLLTLEEPFTCSASPVVSNEIHTVDHIPATLLRGAIYTALMRAGRAADVDAYLGAGPGKPRYSPAWPVVEGMAAVPMPLSFLGDKGDGGLGGQHGCVNSIWFDGVSLPERAGAHRLQWTRPGTKWLLCDSKGQPVRGCSIESASRMHVGLHYGRQASRKGALFSQAEIAEGSKFAFLFDSPAGDLAARVPKALFLGKRRSAGNGAATLAKRPSAPLAKGTAPANEFVVQFLSDCLIPSSTGNWEVGLDEKAWARLLDVPVERVISKSASRPVFGWSGVWGRPREPVVAIAGGSVFRLRLGKGSASQAAAKLAVAETAGLGARVEEGFGWIAVDPAWLFAGQEGQAFGKTPLDPGAPAKIKGQAPILWPGLEKIDDRNRLPSIARKCSNTSSGLPKELREPFARKLAELASLAVRYDTPKDVWQYLDHMAGRDHPRAWDKFKEHLANTGARALVKIEELRFVLSSAAVLSRNPEQEVVKG